MELIPGTVIAGRYRLERPLASGGMGAVWVAHHLTLDAEVAIKFMHDENSVAARGRFEREARSAALIRHPNVVTVQDYGIEGQTPYIAMELLHGENLDDRILHKKRLSLAELEPIASQIARGLRKAHETGIVHRDLKPQNIFLATTEDGSEAAKILDFGIAKEIDTTLGQHTKTTELMGSPHYMSPEQLRSSKKSDFRSDLWSFGVIIYRALTGSVPFPGDTLAEVMVQVFSGKWTPPSKVVPGLPSTIDAFFQRAFARKPDERYQSIHDLHNAFVSVVAGKPLPAAPAPTATTTPIPFASSSPSLPGVVIPSAQKSLAPSLQVGVPSVGFSPPERDVSASRPSAPPTSNPGLSAPPERTSAPGSMPGFGAPNPTPASVFAPPEPQPVIVSLPVPELAPASREHEPAAPSPPPTNLATTVLPGAPVVPIPKENRPSRSVIFAALAGVLVLVSVLFLVLRGPADPEDKPSSGEAVSATSTSATSSSTPTDTTPIALAAATGNALTPDEIAAAVPDETPVEVVHDEPPAPVPSATTQPQRSNWKSIPKGRTRLLVRAKGGVCKITIDGTYYGLTPLDVMVDAGKLRVFCRMATGSTRSKELRAPENRITKIEFEVKQ